MENIGFACKKKAKVFNEKKGRKEYFVLQFVKDNSGEKNKR